MSESIDRQDVIDRLKKAEDVFRRNGAKLEANGIHYALELVESDIEIPTVEPTFKPICEVSFDKEQLKELTDGIVERIKSGELVLQREKRPTEEFCSECQYYKFAQTFINAVVEVMTEYNIESVDELIRIVRGDSHGQ